LVFFLKYQDDMDMYVKYYVIFPNEYHRFRINITSKI